MLFAWSIIPSYKLCVIARDALELKRNSSLFLAYRLDVCALYRYIHVHSVKAKVLCEYVIYIAAWKLGSI